MRVVNRIEDTGAAYRQRTLTQIIGTAVHHFGLPGMMWFDEQGITPDAAGIRKFYSEHPEWTGGKEPYPFVILRDGTIEQARPLSDITPHARSAGDYYIAIAGIGGFQYEPPSIPQWNSLVWLCSELENIPSVKALRGHDEIPGGSRDPRKKCPGRYLDMGFLRTEVALSVETGVTLADSGIIL